ncbi:uncharacterized protein LOC124829526, partial [Vigna umbellata]|uniref:uncharacterized protein LOC124829526 n=1 Tax=Vigna umbellata TaxID=87088 RepID=UPI001F5EBA1A
LFDSLCFSSVCGPTWDFMCYIENFCIANILKLAMVFMLSYVGEFNCLLDCSMVYCILLFFYLVHKLGICGCICRCSCKKIWACLGKLYSGESLSHHFPTRTKISRSISRNRDYKASHTRKSLEPRRHHARVEISRDLRCKSKRNHSLGEPSFTSNAIKHDNHIGTSNHIKVIRTSMFARKGISISRRNRVLPRQRR